MQSTQQFTLSAQQCDISAQNAGLTIDLIQEIVAKQADQLSYMLQTYFPREKVSRVVVLLGSIVIQGPENASMILEFVREEFSSCAAIDTEDKANMNVTLLADFVGGSVLFKGEIWPEL